MRAAEKEAALADLAGGDTGILNGLLLLNADLDGFNADWKGRFRLEASLLDELDKNGKPRLQIIVYAVGGDEEEVEIARVVKPHSVSLDEWLTDAGHPRRGEPGMRPYQIVLNDASVTDIPVAASQRGAQLTNGGCTADKSLMLPPALPGRRIGLLVTAAHNFRAQVQGGDRIAGDGIDPGAYCLAVNSSVINSVIWLTCGVAHVWTIDLGQTGFDMELD